MEKNDNKKTTLAEEFMKLWLEVCKTDEIKIQGAFSKELAFHKALRKVLENFTGYQFDLNNLELVLSDESIPDREKMDGILLRNISTLADVFVEMWKKTCSKQEFLTTAENSVEDAIVNTLARTLSDFPGFACIQERIWFADGSVAKVVNDEMYCVE